MEIVAGNTSREVISQTEGKGEAIEALCRQRGQIVAPERPVVVPGLVLHVTYECSRDASHPVGGLLLNSLGESKCRHWVDAVTHAVRQFQKPVDVTGRV